MRTIPAPEFRPELSHEFIHLTAEVQRLRDYANRWHFSLSSLSPFPISQDAIFPSPSATILDPPPLQSGVVEEMEPCRSSRNSTNKY